MTENTEGTSEPGRPVPPQPAARPTDRPATTRPVADGNAYPATERLAPAVTASVPSYPPTAQQPLAGTSWPPFAPPAPSDTPARSPRRSFGAGTLAAGMLVAGLVGGGVVAGADALLDGPDQVAVSSEAAPRNVVVNNNQSVTEITAAAAKAVPSVVTIAVSAGSGSGSGSGIILDAEGNILTNTHVVTLGGQAAKPAVEVRTSDGRVHQAKVVGTDPLSDLAVIKIDAPNLQPATLGESGKLNVGDTAVAIGAPLGLSGTVTDGIISTLNRTIAVSSSAVPEDQPDAAPEDDGQGWNFEPPFGSGNRPSTGGRGSIYLNVIQTDAAINHGNSGGALVNGKGEIIGVNVAIASGGSAGAEGGNIGVGFAIPIDYAKRVAQEIIDSGQASHGFLGVSVTPKASADSGNATRFSVGAEISEVVADSPAGKAGLRKGDVITELAGLPIEDGQALTASVRQQAAGSTVQVRYLRDGRSAVTDVTLGDSAQQ